VGVEESANELETASVSRAGNAVRLLTRIRQERPEL
jgi:hypothetical protein